MGQGDGRPRLLARSERRQVLMAAAARAFARGGYAATSMDDVAAEAGVSRVLIYRHFDSKAQLYRAILDDTRDKLVQATGAPDELEPASLEALMRVARRDPEAFRLFFRHAGREPEFRQHADWLRVAMTQAAQSHLRQVLPDDALRRWATGLVPALAIEAVLAWLDAGCPQPDSAAGTVATMISSVIESVREAGRT